MSVIGIIPARMQASRFPGKPLAPIAGEPMLAHVVRRAAGWGGWDALAVATCDAEIFGYAEAQGWARVWTLPSHTRCLDRCAEAAVKLGAVDQDIIVVVQGDEPLLRPEMIAAALQPIEQSRSVQATVLAMEIADDAQFRDPNCVKIVHDEHGRVLYTSRAPVPYCAGPLTPEIGARRIFGIFAFRHAALQWFARQPESALERAEACDSNRVCGSGFQVIAPFPFVPAFSVDAPEDVARVEAALAAEASP